MTDVQFYLILTGLAAALLGLVALLLEGRHGGLKAEKRKLVKMLNTISAERAALEIESKLRSEIDGYREVLGIKAPSPPF